jgi:feruloyl-CoA synthase
MSPASSSSRPPGEKPGWADLDLAPPLVELAAHDDGGFVLRSPVPLGDYPVSVPHMLRHWAERTPDAPFLVERDGQGAWRPTTYGQAWTQARRIAAGLLARGLGPDRPVMILSGNGVDHGLLALGAMLAGVPVSPISTAYSLMSADHGKLKHIAELLTPGLVFAGSAQTFGRAWAAIESCGAELVTSLDLLMAEPGPATDAALAALTPDTVAKVLFTSGSTGLPKGVVNTHRMLCANQQMIAQTWPFLARTKPVLVDWLPWNHTFGGNHNFNLALHQGGTLYIDQGKPAPNLIEQTVANLRDVSPTIYFNVPAGFSMLLPYLERDGALRDSFFRRLQLIFYAGAALPQDLWERLENLSIAALGHRVVMTSSWGSTETAPLATSAHFPIERAGVIGIPPPGVDLRLVPNGDKLELRVRGPNVTPGYWRRTDLTAEAFDREGYYRIGDAGRLADANDPSKGIVFDGRVAENFKLATGTWVAAGALRLAAITACAPFVQDALVAGHDRAAVGVLLWLTPAGAADPDVATKLRDALRAWNAGQTGSATRIARALILAEPPNVDANEITDKGYVNQRTALARRAADVERLYAEPPGDGVIVL